MNPEIDFVTPGQRSKIIDPGRPPGAERWKKTLQRNHQHPATVPVGDDTALPGSAAPGPWARTTTWTFSIIRRRRRRLGPRRHPRPDPQPHQGQITELHARPHFLNKFLIIDEAQNLTPQMKP